MKSIIVVTLIAACLSSAGTVSAATKKQAENPWLQEPNSFMGIAFDKSIETSLPACAKGYVVASSPCRDEPYQNLYSIKGTPFLGNIGYSLSAFTLDGKIGSFYLTSKPEDFPELIQIFVTKYGAPTGRSSELVKTKSGAEFTNESIRWSGAKVTILLRKYDGDINTSSASIRTKEYESSLIQEGGQKVNDAASKL